MDFGHCAFLPWLKRSPQYSEEQQEEEEEEGEEGEEDTSFDSGTRIQLNN